jgi:hypothetical protein
MNADFAFVCDFAEATSKINALGIGFDTIYAAQLPVRHPHFSLVLQLRSSASEAGQKRIQVSLFDEDGKDVIPPIQGQFNLPRAEGRLHSVGRFVMEFNSVEFKGYGQYTVSVAVEGIEVASIPFRVAQAPKPPTLANQNPIV